eukprot:4962919-Prymnesium_polylepis.1
MAPGAERLVALLDENLVGRGAVDSVGIGVEGVEITSDELENRLDLVRLCDSAQHRKARSRRGNGRGPADLALCHSKLPAGRQLDRAILLPACEWLERVNVRRGDACRGCRAGRVRHPPFDE